MSSLVAVCIPYHLYHVSDEVPNLNRVTTSHVRQASG